MQSKRSLGNIPKYEIRQNTLTDVHKACQLLDFFRAYHLKTKGLTEKLLASLSCIQVAQELEVSHNPQLCDSLIIIVEGVARLGPAAFPRGFVLTCWLQPMTETVLQKGLRGIYFNRRTNLEPTSTWWKFYHDSQVEKRMNLYRMGFTDYSIPFEYFSLFHKRLLDEADTLYSPRSVITQLMCIGEGFVIERSRKGTIILGPGECLGYQSIVTRKVSTALARVCSSSAVIYSIELDLLQKYFVDSKEKIFSFFRAMKARHLKRLEGMKVPELAGEKAKSPPALLPAPQAGRSIAEQHDWLVRELQKSKIFPSEEYYVQPRRPRVQASQRRSPRVRAFQIVKLARQQSFTALNRQVSPDYSIICYNSILM